MPTAPASFAPLNNVLVSAVLLAALGTPAAAQDMGCVKGNVTDYLGVPIPGTSVRLTLPDPDREIPEVVTDEDGRFEIGELEPGTYKAYAWNSRLGYVRPDSVVFRPGLPSVSVPAGPCVNLTIDAGAPAGHLTLNGRDAVTSEPLGSMVITLARPGRGRSDAESGNINAGQRDFEVPARTDLDLEVSVTGYKRTHYLVKALDPGEIREFDFALDRIGTGCITGTVIDDARSPLEGVKIELHPLDSEFWKALPTGRSEANGQFTIRDIHPAPFAIFTSKENGEYIYSWDTLDDPELPRVTVTPEEACQNLDLALGPRAATVAVTALDAQTGDRIPKISLEFLKVRNTNEGEGLYGLSGEARVPSLTELTLIVSATGYSKTRSILISPLQPGSLWRTRVKLRRIEKQ
jgi:Carboxypeptidase regulatory-like domain